MKMAPLSGHSPHFECTSTLSWVVVQSLSRAGLSATPWTAARQPSLSFTISGSLFKLMSTESVMPSKRLSSVQSLSCVQLFATPWAAAHQASSSITNSQSLLKLMSTESVMSSNHLILSYPSPPAFNLFQHQGLFK